MQNRIAGDLRQICNVTKMKLRYYFLEGGREGRGDFLVYCYHSSKVLIAFCNFMDYLTKKE